MAQVIAYVKDAERMITRARLTRRGIFVRFADEQERLIPFEELKLEAGEQDPHYETLRALAQGLGLPLGRLLVD